MSKILLSDGQLIYCLGINHLLQGSADFEIADIAVTFKELIQKINSHRYDILIIDFDTISDFSIEELKYIKAKQSDLKICVLSACKNRDKVLNVLKCGIINYITKDCDAEEFIRALNATLRKEKYLSSFVLEILLTTKVWSQVEDERANLTNKEIEIIKLLSQGMTTKDIAMKINISHHTVNTHRRNILAKLQINNTSELIMYAVKNGIVESIEYYI